MKQHTSFACWHCSCSVFIIHGKTAFVGFELFWIWYIQITEFELILNVIHTDYRVWTDFEGDTLSARFNGNAMGMARGARFILGRGFLSWGPLGSLSSFPLHNRRAGSGQGSPTQTLTERARRPSCAPSPLDLAVCDSVRESGNVPFWYLPFSGAQFKVLFVGIFSPAPSSILPSDFSSTVLFRLVEIYSDSHCTVDLHYFTATWVTTILKVIRRKEEESDLVPGGMSITFFKSTLLILRVRLRVS